MVGSLLVPAEPLAPTRPGAVPLLTRGVADLRAQLGAVPGPAEVARHRRSPHWRDGVFRNTAIPYPLVPLAEVAPVLQMWREGKVRQRPPRPVPLVRELAPSGGNTVTWYGHASALVEVDGVRVLLDPVWSDRCSPLPNHGPRRLHEVPVGLGELGRIDAVVVSHDHYDHLDLPTVRTLARATDCTFVVPLGVGSHLAHWGVPASRIVELDWGSEHRLGPVRLACLEAQHYSGRGLGRDQTLWASWAVLGSRQVYFSGDTGRLATVADSARVYGGFDLALMAVGAYDDAWAAIHLTPEDAVATALDIGARALLPVHWATFTLAPHPWAEPVERTVAAAARVGLPVVVARPGETVPLDEPTPLSPWWR